MIGKTAILLAAGDYYGAFHPVGVENAMIRVLSRNTELHEKRVSVIYFARVEFRGSAGYGIGRG